MRGFLAALLWAGFLAALAIAWLLPAADLVRYRVLAGVFVFVQSVGLQYLWSRTYMAPEQQDTRQPH